MGIEELDGLPFSDGSWPEDCPFCEGHGVFPATDFPSEDVETEVCPVCRGRGMNVVGGKAELTYRCRYCTGTGRAWEKTGYFVGDRCPVCKGIGSISLGPGSSPDAVNSIWDLIHPAITAVARKKFEDNHFADSVESALKEVNVVLKRMLRERTDEDLDGVKAIERALSVQNPIIRMGPTDTESGRNMQKGYLQIFSGAMTGIRNPKAHENLDIDASRALHHLFVASLLMHKLAESTDYDVRRENEGPVAPVARPD